jgi:hypothetical protein
MLALGTLREAAVVAIFVEERNVVERQKLLSMNPLKRRTGYLKVKEKNIPLEKHNVNKPTEGQMGDHHSYRNHRSSIGRRSNRTPLPNRA